MTKWTIDQAQPKRRAKKPLATVEGPHAASALKAYVQAKYVDAAAPGFVIWRLEWKSDRSVSDVWSSDDGSYGQFGENRRSWRAVITMKPDGKPASEVILTAQKVQKVARQPAAVAA